MPENEKTRLQKFMGGGKQGYQIAFQMAWPAVMESFFIALAGMVDSLMVSSIGAYAVAAVGLRTCCADRKKTSAGRQKSH